MARFESKVLGIDLGTTNTLISYYDEISGRGECCVNQEGTNLTASAVYFETEDSYVVGNVARECALIYPDRTAMYFKRLMGVKKEGIRVNGKIYSPQQLSALVLKSVIESAVAELEEEVKDVIISVPAYFDSSARLATIEAGKLAGLNVLDLIDEPVAALYHCDSMKNLAGKVVLVFDFGGGTLDLVAAEISNSEIDEIAINGDVHLGGCDWDKAFMKYIKTKYLAGKSLDDDDEQKLALDVEKAKKILSNKEKTRITVCSREGRESILLTRAEFEECTRYLLDRVKECIKGLMSDLNDNGIYEFDKVIMVGGSSRMPQMERLIKEIFPNTEIVGKDYDEAVAKGIAAYSKIYSQKGSLFRVLRSFKPKKLNRISTRSYGLAALINENRDKKICNMIYKGSNLPVTVTKKYFTSIDNQKDVNLQVYETVSSEPHVDIKEEYYLGNCHLEIDGDIPKHSDIFVTFTLKEDGTLFVEGKEPKGKTMVNVTMESNALLSGEELLAQKEEIDKLEMQ